MFTSGGTGTSSRRSCQIAPAAVRAETGATDRLYRLLVRFSDGLGGSCSAWTTVCVKKDVSSTGCVGLIASKPCSGNSTIWDSAPAVATSAPISIGTGMAILVVGVVGVAGT